MVAMDLLTLLNTAASSNGKISSREATPSSAHEDLATPPSTAVPTPSPEPSWTRLRVADKNEENTQSWESEEKTPTLNAETGFGWNADFKFPFKSDSPNGTRLDMDSAEGEDSREPSRRPDQIDTDNTSYRLHEPSPAGDAATPSSVEGFRLPEYRGHKFSDSHSSLGSLATSRSEAHSRISSVTTINEIPSIDSVLSEVSRADASSPGLPASSPTQAERRLKFKSQDAGASPRGRGRSGFIVPRITRATSPSDVALNMKQGAGAKAPGSATMSTHSPPRSIGRLPAPRTHKRAVSAPIFPPLPRRLPSFTLNQSRPFLPPPHQMMVGSSGTLGEEANYQRPALPVTIREHEHFRPAMTTRHTDSETPSATATASASASHTRSPGSASQSLVSPPRSQPDDVWDIDDENLRMPSLEELELHGMQDETVRCIFVDKCATNSPIRKSVSHFFGRNKGTTLQIPEHIWLVYCRQHYQRLRYRLGRKYSLHQLDLVKVVIHRIERWGKENKAKSDGAEVLDWQILLRKCVRDEQERWTRFKQDLRRQGLSQQEQDERYEAFKTSRVGPSSHSQGMGSGMVDNTTNSAAETLLGIEQNYPWLLDTLGDHRTETEVIAVIDRLRQDYRAAMDAKSPTGVSITKELPPIEFLPNLSNDNDERPVKTGRKRGPSRNARESESFKRRTTRSVESPDDAASAEIYSRSAFAPSHLSHPNIVLPMGGRGQYDHSQMGHWMDKPATHSGLDKDVSRSSYIVPQMKPLHGHRSSLEPTTIGGLEDLMPPMAPRSGHQRAVSSVLPLPRPTHHRSASAFTPPTRYTPGLEWASSSGEDAAGDRAYEHGGDYFTSFAPAPQRTSHVFGDLGGYQTAPSARLPVFDFTPRTRPGGWAEGEAHESSRVPAWPVHEASSGSLGMHRGEEHSQIGNENR